MSPNERVAPGQQRERGEETSAVLDDGGALSCWDAWQAIAAGKGSVKPALAEAIALGFIEVTPGYACANPLYERAAIGSFVAGTVEVELRAARGRCLWGDS